MPSITAANLVLTVCLLIFTVVAATIDVRTRRLPNRLMVPMCLAGLIFHLIVGGIEGGFLGAGQGLLFSLGGFASGFVLLLVLWLIGGGGGGDVKYMGTLGAWLGPQLTIYVMIAVGILVAFGSVGVLAVQFCRLGFSGTQKKYFASASASQKTRKGQQPISQQERAARRRLLPFALPAALATWLVLIVTQFVMPK